MPRAQRHDHEDSLCISFSPIAPRTARLAAITRRHRCGIGAGGRSRPSNPGRRRGRSRMTSAIRDEAGDVLAHYATPIVEGASVYAEIKGPTYTQLAAWETQSWGIRRWGLEGRRARRALDFREQLEAGAVRRIRHQSVRRGADLGARSSRPRPASDYLWVPAARGRVFKVRKADGGVQALIDPFDGAADDHTTWRVPSRRVREASTSMSSGSILSPWDTDAVGSWLVRIAPDGAVSKVSYAGLVPSAPAAAAVQDAILVVRPPVSAGARCRPSDDPVRCPASGSQRDAGLFRRRRRIHGEPGAVQRPVRLHDRARPGSFLPVGGVSPGPPPRRLQRRRPDQRCAGRVSPGHGRRCGPFDQRAARRRRGRQLVRFASLAPDGSVLYGSNTRCNFAQGHLLKFSGQGTFEAAYGFGWDTTPVIHRHDGHLFDRPEGEPLRRGLVLQRSGCLPGAPRDGHSHGSRGLFRDPARSRARRVEMAVPGHQHRRAAPASGRKPRLRLRTTR